MTDTPFTVYIHDETNTISCGCSRMERLECTGDQRLSKVMYKYGIRTFSFNGKVALKYLIEDLRSVNRDLRAILLLNPEATMPVSTLDTLSSFVEPDTQELHITISPLSEGVQIHVELWPDLDGQVFTNTRAMARGMAGLKFSTYVYCQSM